MVDKAYTPWLSWFESPTKQILRWGFDYKEVFWRWSQETRIPVKEQGTKTRKGRKPIQTISPVTTGAHQRYVGKFLITDPKKGDQGYICTQKFITKFGWYKKYCVGAPGWLSWLSVQLLILAPVMISSFMRSSPMSRSVCWHRGDCLEFSLSPSLSAPPPLMLHAFSLSVFQNK